MGVWAEKVRALSLGHGWALETSRQTIGTRQRDRQLEKEVWQEPAHYLTWLSRQVPRREELDSDSRDYKCKTWTLKNIKKNGNWWISSREDKIIPTKEMNKVKFLKWEDRDTNPRWEVMTDTQQEEEHPHIGPPSVLEVEPRLDNVVQCLTRGQSIGHITVTH